MPGLDVFSGNAFSMQSLTARLLDRAHVPMRLGQLGIFQAEGIRTLDVSVEKQGNTLVLVQTTERGAPAKQNVKDGRTVVKLPTRRVALEDTINADEVQNVRAFGSESELDTLQAEVDRRNDRMDLSIVATEEFHRIGAMKGIILDADGSTLIDLFTTFGVTAQSEVDFDLDNATPASGALRKKCASVIRIIQDALGGLPFNGVHCMCSSQFWDDLIAHPEVRETVKNFPAALTLRESGVGRAHGNQPIQVLNFGGITFEEYRGAIGSTKYVADDKAHLFPTGAPELFLSRYAPAEYWDTVNTIGLPRYARINPDGTDPDHKRTIRLQSQLLHFCTRPRTLVPAKRT